MLEVHAVLGIITLIISVALLVWNALRLARSAGGPSFRMVLVGLLDLQVLLGIITLVLHPRGGAWLLHPLLMLIAVVLGHTLLKESRSKRQQLFGYLGIFVLLILGVLAAANL